MVNHFHKKKKQKKNGNTTQKKVIGHTSLEIEQNTFCNNLMKKGELSQYGTC